jgi:hypothetical protein
VKLEVVFLILLAVSAASPRASSTSQQGSQNNSLLYFNTTLSNLNDRIPSLSTNSFVFNLRTQQPSNEPFRIVLLFAHPLNISETMDLAYASHQEFDGTQFLETNDTEFYSHNWSWYLFKCGGPFPLDSLCWYMLVGSSLPFTPAYQPQVYNTEVTGRWVISSPAINLIPLDVRNLKNGLPDEGI